MGKVHRERILHQDDSEECFSYFTLQLRNKTPMSIKGSNSNGPDGWHDQTGYSATPFLTTNPELLLKDI